MARFRTIKKRLGIDMAKPGTAPVNTPTKVTKRGAQSTPAGKAVKRTKTYHDDVDDGSEGYQGSPLGKNHVKPEPEIKKEIKSEEESEEAKVFSEKRFNTSIYATSTRRTQAACRSSSFAVTLTRSFSRKLVTGFMKT
ncbi:hypothetical protein PG994_007481 [Apiospora phragmitis]|uniref:Uncharacterized protein n=1 Tax=Apiospora phragmitis TaxID=2905665 RepID=A0ABR1V0X5_9PEZI